MGYEVKASTQLATSHRKIMFWGKTGTRKTESVLRYFPHVLLIDTEGNAEQTIGMPEIPEFLLVKTKDNRVVLQVLDDVAQGKLKFPDGSPVETVAFDSVSVLWSVQQEVASSLAERRAAKYNRPIDEATTTQLDWVVSKRPMKRINTRLNGTPIKYLILIAREKDLYKEESKDKLVKIGVQPDAMKGTEYEMNLILRFDFEELEGGKRGKWFCEVTKVQGALGKGLPMGKRFFELPVQQMLVGDLTGKPQVEQSEDELAADIAGMEMPTTRTLNDLIEYGKQLGIPATEVGPILKTAGFTGFKPELWDELTAILDKNSHSNGHNNT